jgi:hypothetical protein
VCIISGIRAKIRYFKLTVNYIYMVSTKYKVEIFNGKNNLSLWQMTMKDLLIQQRVLHKALLCKAKKLKKMGHDE